MGRLPAVVAIDFGGTKTAVAIGDAMGVRLGYAVVASLPDHGAEAALDRGLSAAENLVRALPPNYELAAVGAVTFGIPHGDRVDLAPAIPGWEQVHFGDVIRSRFPGVPVRIGTDVKAAAVAELTWGALVGIDTGIYVNLGTGLAAAIIVDGSVLLGADRAAGEIGYSLRSVADVRGARDGGRVLENFVSGHALVARARQSVGGVVAVASDIFTAATTNRTAAQLVDEFVDELAFHLVNLAIAINPVRIVLGGGLMAAWPHFVSPLREAMARAVPYPPEIARAEFPYDAALMGAVAIGAGALASAAGSAPLTSSATAPGKRPFGQERIPLCDTTK